MSYNNYNRNGYQATAITTPPKHGERSDPDIRRESLVPKATPGRSGWTRDQKYNSVHERGLFNFGLKELMDEILLKDGKSHVSYHEYAVFAPLDGEPRDETHFPSITSEGENALHMFRNALKKGHGLDSAGNFTANPKGNCLLKGRVRQVITRRRTSPRQPDESSHASDGLDLTVNDFEALNLHPVTLASIRRTTSEAFFWDAKREAFRKPVDPVPFSSNPRPLYDFLSMTYTLGTKTTTALVRHSFDAKRKCEDAVSEYERRLDSCRARWAHPLVLPVVLIQVQLLRTEDAVKANDEEVHLLEKGVRAVTGTTEKAKDETNERYGTRDAKVLSIDSTTSRLYESDYVAPKSMYLMNAVHDALKSSVQLLHTLIWIERVIKLLMQVGDELDARVKDIKTETSAERSQGDDLYNLSFHWCEIRQYLDSIWQLCTSLETDRGMSELRCRAQKEIIFSILAQEDKDLDTRMAIAAMRDNSSMKVLAIITAIFLPAELIGTLFGMPMFSCDKETGGDSGNTSGVPKNPLPSPSTPPFWIYYWAITIPLTLLVLAVWRGWWVNQDRYFRRHLSKELSNKRYWTTDGRLRDLETTFMQDFFSPFRASGAKTTTKSTIFGIQYRPRPGGDNYRGQCGRPETSKPNHAFSRFTSAGRYEEGASAQEELGVVQRLRRISFGPEPWTRGKSVV
ncbi:hypothetical protein F5Y03DRAFT_389298 [Xylaria venustula]|nr:hypothetical protein F5Y03DRAFT_389298 [Xylaria venustula]